jgi:opacity protein-like surface antigen
MVFLKTMDTTISRVYVDARGLSPEKQNPITSLLRLSMKRKIFLPGLAVSLFLIVLVNTAVWAEEYTAYYHVQGMLGRMTLEEGDYLLEGDPGTDDDYLFDGDSVDLPMFGAAVGLMLGGDRLEYGVEGGGQISWKADRWKLFISSGGSSIHLESSTFLMDLFFGGTVATDIGERLRLYLGAGPLVIFGNHKVDPDNPRPEPYPPYRKTTVSDWDVGLYTRTGLEFRFTDELIAGIGVRWIETQLDFSNPGGKTDVEGLQILFTMATAIDR